MKIGGVGLTKVVSIYNDNKRVMEKKAATVKSDSVQISSVGKSLSAISSEDHFGNSPQKVESIRNEVSTGTYKRDANLTAAKMMEYLKGREI